MSAGTDSFDFRYALKLSGISIILQTLGWTIPTFPFFQFFAFTPLIALCYHSLNTRKKLSVELFIIFLISFTIPCFFKWITFQPSILNFIAGISPALTLLLWYYSGTILNSLKSFYLVVFWLGIEFIFVSLNQPVFDHLPGAAFRMWGESVIYIKYTGFQSTTLWLLLANILFTHCIFKIDGELVEKLHRIPFLLASLVAVMPMAISMFLFEGQPDGDLTSFFMNPQLYISKFNSNSFYSFYLDNGEYAGKLSFWLSIVIIMSLLIKQLRSGYGNKNRKTSN